MVHSGPTLACEGLPTNLKIPSPLPITLKKVLFICNFVGFFHIMNRHLASKMSTDLSFSLDTSPPRVTQNLALWMSMPWACRCHVKSWRISTKSKHKGIQHQIQIQLKLCLAKPVFGEFPAAPCYLRCPEGT